MKTKIWELFFFLLKTNLETLYLSLQNNFQAKAGIEQLKVRFILKDFFNHNFRAEQIGEALDGIQLP